MKMVKMTYSGTNPIQLWDNRVVNAGDEIEVTEEEKKLLTDRYPDGWAKKKASTGKREK